MFRTTSISTSTVYCIGVVVSIGRPRPRFGRPGRHLGGKVQGMLEPFSACSLTDSSAPAAGMIESFSLSNMRSCQSMEYVGSLKKGVNVAGEWTGQSGLEDDHRNMALGVEEVVAEQGSGVGS